MYQHDGAAIQDRGFPDLLPLISLAHLAFERVVPAFLINQPNF
jgi:hypothetical protein